MIDLSKVRVSKDREAHVVPLLANERVLTKALPKLDEDTLLALLVVEARGRKRLALCSRIIARLGALYRGALSQQVSGLIAG